MSTAANPASMKAASRGAPFFVACVGAGAAALVAHSVLRSDHWYPWEFFSLLLVAVLTSRLKIKLPGVNGNMSVSLPFIFVAMTQLSLPEALFVSGVSVFVQSLPKRPNKFKPVQVLFNVCSGLLACGLGWETLHYTTVHVSSALALVMACATHLLVSTVAVATIISLTENQGLCAVWSNIVQLSFPYYLASAGIASIAAAFETHTTWPMLIGIACVMFVTYRSYRLYFGMVSLAVPARVPTAAFQTKSAAAGH
jgi:hypothetical protein